MCQGTGVVSWYGCGVHVAA